jgi:hypothetical protein
MVVFSRLLEIRDGSPPSDEELLELRTYNSVYVIFNDKLNMAYIGETDNTWYRIFNFWKVDKRHVDGRRSPIHRLFEDDYDNTIFMILETDCNNQEREYYWDEWYRSNTNYLVVSQPGRPHIKVRSGYKVVNNGIINKQVPNSDIDKYLDAGWMLGYTPNVRRITSDRLIGNHNTLNHKWVNKDGVETSVKSEDYQSYLDSGWLPGRITSIIPSNRGKIAINNGTTNKYVGGSELDKWLSDGWLLGSKWYSKGKGIPLSDDHKKNLRRPNKKYLFKRPDGTTIILSKPGTVLKTHTDWINLGLVTDQD